MGKRIILTVTNDLSYDQRMQRICTALANAGYEVLLVGRQLPTSIPLPATTFQQKRLKCYIHKGFLFYVLYNIRLFLFLLVAKADAVCAIDLDTILPCLWASKIKQWVRVYDAHELFTEQIEIVSRKRVHQFWLAIERYAVPQFKNGYTVNLFIQAELNRRYQVQYGIVRNLPAKPTFATSANTLPISISNQNRPIILYQGAVNEGRCFETLIPAMQQVEATLLICGTGNFFTQTQQLVQQYQVDNKVVLMGAVIPTQLQQITPQAFCGVTLFESQGLNQYYSLANRFFDYIMGGIPQLCVNYPEYAAINQEHHIALLIDDTNATTIAAGLNKLLTDTVLYKELKTNALQAQNFLNWENEQQHLITHWKQFLASSV